MKKRNVTRWLGLTLCAALAAGALAGCGSGGQGASSPAADSAGESADSAGGSADSGVANASETLAGTEEEVVLKMFAVADAPLNQRLADEYWPVLNDAVKEAVNATIDYTYASGNDYTNNYQLALASGENTI